MYQRSVPHHTTGGFTSHRSFLSDEAYGSALDCLVKACSDMLLVSLDGKVFLGKRRVHPQPDWWFVGGRIFPGETPIASCQRLLRRELGLEIEASRFSAVCAQSLAWGMRQQEPKDHGTTDSQVVLTLQLEPPEVSKVVLDEKEYVDSQWIAPDAILSGHFHPALKVAVRSLIAARKVRELEAAVAAAANDAAVAALAREFCALSTQPLPAGESEYRVVAPDLAYECGVTTSGVSTN
jgi:8-oxo-dGTP pyrophosphatase MutT (NUDIX family)